jgi:hypothetical protein
LWNSHVLVISSGWTSNGVQTFLIHSAFVNIYFDDFLLCLYLFLLSWLV